MELLADTVTDLKVQVKHLEECNHQLQETVMQLRQQVDVKPSLGATYPLREFIIALAARRKRTYGWKKDYAQATEDTPDCLRVTIDDIQKWQRQDRVPLEAFVQIERLQYPVRKSK